MTESGVAEALIGGVVAGGPMAAYAYMPAPFEWVVFWYLANTLLLLLSIGSRLETIQENLTHE